jgi:autotransporter-associated beta strand protein
LWEIFSIGKFQGWELSPNPTQKTMKPIKSNRFSLLVTASSLLFGGALYSQTVEINPAGAIPAAFNLAQGWEWNDAGVLESWTANTDLTLEVGTPTIDEVGPPANGSVKGTAAAIDPVFGSPITTIATPYRVIIEMRVKKEASDTTRMDLFWDDAAGGIGTPGKSVSIPAATLAPDDTFKIVRITFPFGRISGQLDQLRFDPISDAAGVGKTVAIDYMRVYTEVPTPLSWDADTVTTDAQGGTGTWDQLTSNLWWDGAANTTWPASGVRAVFGGTAGTVTVAGGGVSANIAEFQTTGYTVTGGPIAIGSDSARFSNSVGTVTTRIDSPLTGSASSLFTGGNFILGGNNTSLSGPVTLLSPCGITNNNAVGTGTLTLGAINNVFVNALDGDRTIGNNVIFAGNRMVINNTDLGTGLAVGNLTIDGNLALNGTSPADLFLRKNLTVNGVVSGSNSNIGLLLASNSGIIKLTNAGNNFTGNITWAVGSTVEADSNGALGALANNLRFNVSGSLKMLAAFDSARAIVIANNVAGAAGANTTLAQFNTNGFDSTWTGTISAPVFAAPATAQQITTFVKQGGGILTLDSGGTTANNLRSGGIRVDGGTLKIASGAITTGGATANGVNGGSFLEINGGSLSTGNFSVGKSAGTATFTLNGGTYTNTSELLVAFNLGDGGIADLNNFSMVDKAGLTSTMNLNGGEVRLNFFNARFTGALPAIATSIINFNGSTVRAKSNRTDFIETNTATVINAQVQAGGAIFDTTNGATTSNITINQPLVHDPDLGVTLDGGLTKRSLGTLTLTAANTYTGPTTVEGGNLLVNGDHTAATGATNVNATAGLGGDGTINAATYADGARFPWTVADWTAAPSLSAGAVTIAGALTVVVGENALANFTDAAASFTILSASSLTVTNPAGLTVDDTAFTTGTGTWSVQQDGNTLKLVYTPGPANFAAWASAFTSPALSPSGAADDADFDGLSNAVEFVIGGDPRVSSQAGKPTSSVAAGVITFSFNREDSSETPDVTTIVQVSNDLVDWTTEPSYTVGATTATSTAGVVVAENAGAPDTITVTIPNTGAAKKFARLSVVITP